MLVCEPEQRRGRNKGKTATGSHAGYMRHRKAGEIPCEACRLGHRDTKRNLYRTNVAYRERNKALSRKGQLAQYGLTPESYDALLQRQGGGCAICGTTNPGDNRHRFDVDHDHGCCPGTTRCCGKCVRGLLCGSCNKAIGLLGDNVRVLESAIRYLKKEGS